MRVILIFLIGFMVFMAIQLGISSSNSCFGRGKVNSNCIGDYNGS
jgi:hypothetical protein